MEYVLVFILTILTVAFWSGKGSWLIAGYNTMDGKEKIENLENIFSAIVIFIVILTIVLANTICRK